jgi:hypothetical protein
MRRYILASLFAAGALLAFLSLPAMAGQLVMQDGSGNVVRLFDRACTHGGVLALIRPEYRDRFLTAEVTIDRRSIAACWIRDPDGDVYVMLEDGRNGFFEGRGFSDEPGA